MRPHALGQTAEPEIPTAPSIPRWTVCEGIWRVQGISSLGSSWSRGRGVAISMVEILAKARPITSAALGRDEPVCATFSSENDSAAESIYYTRLRLLLGARCFHQLPVSSANRTSEVHPASHAVVAIFSENR